MPRRKRSEYGVALDRAGGAAVDGRDAHALGDEWTPEHLVLAALARCIVTSLGYHARRDSLDASAAARASGAVFERPDGSWGFVELACRIDATVEPPLPDDDLADLLGRAERGCFVGSSLDPRPTYVWRVNDVAIG